MVEPRPREELLQARLAELVGVWLEVVCSGCDALVLIPCPLLARERGAQLCVGDTLGRLRCRQCGSRPKSVAVTNDPTRGDAMAWRVSLVP